MAFVASGMVLALAPRPQGPLRQLESGAVEPIQPYLLADVFLRPEDQATWIMAGGIWLTMLLFAMQLTRDYTGANALPVADVTLLIWSFLAGAAWPWLALQSPLLGFLLCVTMLVALITVTSREWTDGRLGREPFIGILTGWTTILTFSAFSTFISQTTAMPAELATLVSAVLACAATMAIQMRMPGNACYTITVMFGFLALAAAMINAAPAIAVISVLSLAVLTFLLVRVTT